MKRYLLALPLLALLLVSCPSSPPEATIINNSSYPVTFIVRQGTFTLNPTEFVNIQMYGPPNVSNFNPLTVSYKRADMTGEFYNTAPIDLYVLNTGSKTVELSAGGYIGIGNPTMGTYTVGEPLSISASGDTGKEIYTSTPVFAAVFIDSGVRYPATVNYTYDPVNNRITVTVLYSL